MLHSKREFGLLVRWWVGKHAPGLVVDLLLAAPAEREHSGLVDGGGDEGGGGWLGFRDFSGVDCPHKPIYAYSL